MAAPLVFFDIAAPDLAAQAAFYRAVFGWEIGADGGFSVNAASPLPATLRVEPPSMGPVIERVLYFGVEDVTATLATVAQLGGKTVFPRFVVPGRVILALFTDPAGNRVGLVEIKDGAVIVPPAA
ncbi:MAG TPA: VOC family protein [Caulobacteraceae bacterium]|jgi:hypothetical protein